MKIALLNYVENLWDLPRKKYNNKIDKRNKYLLIELILN